jgi:predicted outer membrane protein
MAAMGGMAEVEMGRIALQRASSEAVKQYAQRMIDDHTQANQELMQIAGSKGITLPTDMSTTGGTNSEGAAGTAKDHTGGQNTPAAGGTSDRSAPGTGGSTSRSGATAEGATVSGGNRGAANTGSKDSEGTSDTRGMHAKHQAKMSRLSGLSGAEFDREYIMQAGNKDHEEQAKLYQSEASRGSDPELKAFAAKTLPIVQSHLAAARDLAKTNKGGAANTKNQGGSTGGDRTTP